jgi:hypothetical protein
MPPGRNDPCPCGSGRKYKQCCQSADTARAAAQAAEADRGRPLRSRDVSHAPEVLRAIREEPEWSADAVPLPIHIEQGDAGRPVALLVVAGEFVVYSNTLGRLRGGAEAVAAALEGALRHAARIVGHWPEVVFVRHDDTAVALAPLLDPLEVEVRAAQPQGLQDAAESLLDHFTDGEAAWPPICATDRWRDWDLADAVAMEVFEAAADFYRQAPWKVAQNLQAPRAVLPSGRAWTCCIMGAAGEEYGLALYSDPADLFERSDGPANEVFSSVVGRVVSLLYNSPDELPPVALREVATNRWPIGGRHAYPRIFTINTPGGGVSGEDAGDLALLLRALPAWVAAHRGALLREEDTSEPMPPAEWTDPATGVTFSYAGEGVGAAYADHDEYEPALPMTAELRGDLEEVLAAARETVGADATDQEFMTEVNRVMQARMGTINRRPQTELGGLSPVQVRQLFEADWNDSEGVIRLTPDLAMEDVLDAPFVANAATLLDMARERGGLPATQAGNLGTALVRELLDRFAFVNPATVEVTRSFGSRTWEQDFGELHRLRVVCEMAGLLERRSTRFVLPRGAGRLADPDQAGELFLRLFVTWFRKFNTAYGTRIHWPELQQQVAFTLVRLQNAAAMWRTAEDLVSDVVLPYARERLRTHSDADYMPRLGLALLVLDPLVGFGLLQRREGSRGRPHFEEFLYRRTPLMERFVRVQWRSDGP